MLEAVSTIDPTGVSTFYTYNQNGLPTEIRSG
jgi:YD repeat-containing protein